MRSKNHAPITIAESEHMHRVKCLPCVVCDAPAPSEAHHPEQQMHWITVALCALCHRGPEGWHGTRLRWRLRKVSELSAINATIEALYG